MGFYKPALRAENGGEGALLDGAFGWLWLRVD